MRTLAGSLAICAVAAFSLTLAGCSTLAASFMPSALLGTVTGAAAGNPSDTAKLDQLVRVGKAVGKAAQEITPEQEYYIGRAVAATVLRKYRPWDGPAATQYINTLGQTLALASREPETFGGYHFLVMDTDDINAFGCPGGLILVSRGLLRCADSEDEVAAILSHEIGHVSLKHGLNAISTARWTEAGLELGKYAAQSSSSDVLRDLTSSFGDVIGDIVKTMVNTGYSKELEKQADLEAIGILARVGYDPAALIRVLQHMKPHLNPGHKDFSSTHPAPDTRIAYLKDAIAKMRAVAVATPDQLQIRQVRYSAAMGGI
jgi:predicted Zn-dependent protease